ncbi:hypothetical protein, partial [Pseudomonas savastanoi]
MPESKVPLQGSQTDGTPAGGWPALSAVNKHLLHQHVLIKGNRTLLSMNWAACGCKLWDFEIGYHSRNRVD